MRREIFAIFSTLIILTVAINAESSINNIEKKYTVDLEIYSEKTIKRYGLELTKQEVEKLRKTFLHMARKVENMDKSVALDFIKKEITKMAERYNFPTPTVFNSAAPCLVIGNTDVTLSTGFGWASGCAIMYGIAYLMELIYKFLHSHGIYYFSHLLYLLLSAYIELFFMCYMGLAFLSYLNSFPILGTIFIGGTFMPIFGPTHNVPGEGWIYVIGLEGVKKYGGKMYGNADFFPAPFIFGIFYPAIIGFTGIRILISEDIESLYAGTAFKVAIGDSPP